jgi:type IV pilus assembly protein PilC
MLDRVASYMEKTETLKKKVKKAMTYPISVVVVAFIVTVILLVKVVPQFEMLFSGFGAELPIFTQFVVGISEWMQEYWLLVIAVIAASVYIFKEVKLRSEKFRDALDRFMLKMPIVGLIIHKSSVARFARVLSTTFAAGVPLVDALESVAGATGNVVYRDAVLTIRDEVSSGTQLQFAMKQTGVFPSMAVQMVAIGEESGALDSMLDKVAEHFEEEVDNLVDNMTTLMEPMIMAVLGVLVGGLIIAMYLPIFQMGAVV